jgi:hypothetical protein
MTGVSVWRFSRASESAFEVLCLLAFGVAGLAYFLVFSFDLDRYLFREGFFELALNSHDHLVYVATLDALRANGIQYGLNNDFGIAGIYLVLGEFFPFLVNDQLTLLSFMFNTAVLIPTYLLWAKICDFYGLSLNARLAFFLNTSLLYFMQLINKDMLTIFAFLLAVYAGTHRRLFVLVLAVPILFFVRQQLAVFAILFVYFMRTPQPQKRMIFAYVITSVVAGVLSVFASVIGEDSLGDGFSAYLTQLNSQYYIGYLIFNPLRVVQYIVDVYMSFSVFTETGTVDVAKLLRLPQLLLLAALWKPCLEMVRRFNLWLYTPARPLILTVVAYLLAWLMNPTVNARYVMLITPVLVIFAFYVNKIRRTAEISVAGNAEQ